MISGIHYFIQNWIPKSTSFYGDPLIFSFVKLYHAGPKRSIVHLTTQLRFPGQITVTCSTSHIGGAHRNFSGVFLSLFLYGIHVGGVSRDPWGHRALPPGSPRPPTWVIVPSSWSSCPLEGLLAVLDKLFPYANQKPLSFSAATTREHGTLAQCWFDVGPLAQHQTSIGLTSRVRFLQEKLYHGNVTPYTFIYFNLCHLFEEIRCISLFGIKIGGY